MTVTEKLAALRQNMEARGLEGCIVVTDDFHGSEYVGAHFKAREFRRNGSWRAAAYS